MNYLLQVVANDCRILHEISVFFSVRAYRFSESKKKRRIEITGSAHKNLPGPERIGPVDHHTHADHGVEVMNARSVLQYY
jgi:hypothetical protein